MIPRTPIILPRGAGEGDRPKGGGRGALLASLLIQLKPKKAPTTMLRMVPLPRFAGEEPARQSSFVQLLNSP